MFEAIQNLDQSLTAFLSSLFPHTSFFDSIFSFLSLTGLTVIIWLLLLVIYLVFKEKHDIKFITYFLFSFSSSYLFVNGLKLIFQRERPYIVQDILISICPKDFSFPSGHAAGAFAGAVIFSAFDKKRKWLYYFIAIMISYSRIYLTCHYLVDVVVGALIGYFVSVSYLKILSRRIRI